MKWISVTRKQVNLGLISAHTANYAIRLCIYAQSALSLPCNREWAVYRLLRRPRSCCRTSGPFFYHPPWRGAYALSYAPLQRFSLCHLMISRGFFYRFGISIHIVLAYIKAFSFFFLTFLSKIKELRYETTSIFLIWKTIQKFIINTPKKDHNFMN